MELAAHGQLKVSFELLLGKRCLQFVSAVFERIHFIHAGKMGLHKSLGGFKFLSDWTNDYRVRRP